MTVTLTGRNAVGFPIFLGKCIYLVELLWVRVEVFAGSEGSKTHAGSMERGRQVARYICTTYIILSQCISSSPSSLSACNSGKTMTAFTSESFTMPSRLQTPKHINAQVNCTERQLQIWERSRWP